MTRASVTKVPAKSSLTQSDEAAQRSNSVRSNCPLVWTIVALSLAAAIRLAAATGDLAIDEIWSLLLVRDAIHSFVDIFVLRHDNNHLLNTMMLYVIGPDAAGLVYRIPAVFASIGSVWLAGRIAIRNGGFPAARMAWIFVGSSYLLILYGAEARGYSYAVFFAYLSWLCLLRTHASGRWTDAAAFAISACLGFLAHLTFLYCYAGFCVWSIWQRCRKPNWIFPLAHVLPTLMAGFLYLIFIRGMAIGGGPVISLTGAIISTLSIVCGGPQFDDGAVVVALLVTLILGCSFVRLWRVDRPAAACHLTIIVLAPAAVLMVTGHGVIYPRYFIVPVAFALLIISDTISAWRPTGGVERAVRIGIIAAYLSGNLWWTARLLDYGRGDYSGALAWMVSQSAGGLATVTSDHDFRNGLIVDYYVKRRWPKDSPIRYVAQSKVPPQGPDWLILHNFEGDPSNPVTLTDRVGNQYQLERTYWHRSLTGWNWWIYHRIQPAARSTTERATKP